MKWGGIELHRDGHIHKVAATGATARRVRCKNNLALVVVELQENIVGGAEDAVGTGQLQSLLSRGAIIGRAVNAVCARVAHRLESGQEDTSAGGVGDRRPGNSGGLARRQDALQGFVGNRLGDGILLRGLGSLERNP